MQRNTLTIIIVIVVVGIFLCTYSARAQGLLGKRYAGFMIGQTNPGDNDVERIDDAILELGAEVNIPINPNADVNFSTSYAKLDGEVARIDVEATAIGLLGGINYHFSPERNINPYIGVDAGIVRRDVEVSGSGNDEDETDFAFSLGGGMEIDLSPQVALRPSMGYSRVGDDDDIHTGISLSYWFNQNVFGLVGLSYAFDEGDLTYGVGLGMGF